ncbi:MAG: hypothetical protein IPH26_10710 [Sterolibacteriaceae bacterium]|uniref:Uncharacterized protein n=1 Tax=Candidatus Methylophosphatis roskildensis TaxID=2899263 RepID=A0A9D7E948_9PROT|nr:hypothetical protein [Candidatus Methylophosphatis roskildensis]MBK7236870.1 hypothetical protein [Sterolibacteriaceae bacterium]
MNPAQPGRACPLDYRCGAAAIAAAPPCLAALPRFARCDVDETRVVVVHGDADSLAGWGFGIDALDDAAVPASALT